MVHLGHLMPWFLTKHLQDKFDSNLLFQITDDEKFLFGNKTMDEINKNVYENILDIIAIGFKKSKTKIIVNSRHINRSEERRVGKESDRTGRYRGSPYHKKKKKKK